MFGEVDDIKKFLFLLTLCLCFTGCEQYNPTDILSHQTETSPSDVAYVNLVMITEAMVDSEDNLLLNISKEDFVFKSEYECSFEVAGYCIDLKVDIDDNKIKMVRSLNGKEGDSIVNLSCSSIGVDEISSILMDSLNTYVEESIGGKI